MWGIRRSFQVEDHQALLAVGDPILIWMVDGSGQSFLNLSAIIPTYVTLACRYKTTCHFGTCFSRNAPPGFRSCEQVKLCVWKGLWLLLVLSIMQIYLENGDCFLWWSQNGKSHAPRRCTIIPFSVCDLLINRRVSYPSLSSWRKMDAKIVPLCWAEE